MPTVPKSIRFAAALQASCPLRPEHSLVVAALGDAVGILFHPVLSQ